MTLKCFVAMALDHEDTDRLYDKIIKTVLRKRGITPFRIDRREHNEDIDDVIISELRNCDLALADLTYARPSVYFEAGFAQRAAPVIYTCRNDHLRPRPNDEFGNFRVHFDLLMKNIIAWSSSTDARFAKRLERRISYITAPLLRAKKLDKKSKEESDNFNLLSLRERIQRLERLTARKFQHAGFRLKSPGYLIKRVGSRLINVPGGRFLPDTKWSLKLAGVQLLTRFRKGVISCVLVHFTDSFGHQIFDRFHSMFDGDRNLSPHDLYGLFLKFPQQFFGGTVSIRDVLGWRDCILLCSFQKVNLSRIATNLSYFQLDMQKKAFERKELGGPVEGTTDLFPPRTTTFYILDGIKHEREFAKRLNEILATL